MTACTMPIVPAVLQQSQNTFTIMHIPKTEENRYYI